MRERPHHFFVAADMIIITGSATNTSNIQMIITPLTPLKFYWDHPRVCGKDLKEPLFIGICDPVSFEIHSLLLTKYMSDGHPEGLYV